jgi:hypothetical protein
MKTPPRGGASLLTYRVALAVLLTTLLVTTLLLAGLLLTTLLLLTGLRLSAALLATLLLTTLLLLARLLVWILVLIHLYSPRGWKRRSFTTPRNVIIRKCPYLFPPSARTICRNAKWNLATAGSVPSQTRGEPTMGRYLLLWLLGIPIPILVLIWLFGGLH